MNILICAKQVPDVSLVTVDKEKKCLVLDGVASVLNPYDGYALEAAARIKDSSPETKIIALTLGDESCKTALKDCLGIAADKAYIASSSALEKSDSLGIAQLLAAAIKKIELEEGAFDAVFCGKQTVDGDGALVGAELAELLGYPQVTSALSAAAGGDGLVVEKQGESCTEKVSLPLPCVVTFTGPGYEPRFPTLKRKLAANRAQIPVYGEDALADADLSCVGEANARCRLVSTYVPVRSGECVFVSGESKEETAAKMADILNATHLI